MTFLAVLTILAVTAVVYHHVGYSLILRRMSLRAPNVPEITPRGWVTSHADGGAPLVTIIVPAYQEQAYIADKVHNLAALDYPADRLQVIIACDGCSDATAALARAVTAQPECAWLPLEVREFAENRGKVAVLNELMSGIRGGIVAVSDVSALVPVDALLVAADRFRDPTVGVVAGTYRLLRPGSPGEQTYWSYQTSIKRGEAALGSVLGAHGAFYLFRRDLFTPLAPDTVNDDFVLPATIVLAGHRAVYDERITALESERATTRQDHRRRRRIAAGNLQQLVRLRRLLSPRYGGTAFAFASGKALRVLMPPCLALALVGSLVLAPHSAVFLMLAAAQVLGYTASGIALAIPGTRIGRAAAPIGYLVAGHVASAFGMWSYLRRHTNGPWSRERNGASSHIHPVTAGGKRLFDLVGATVGLIVAAPLFPLIALAIRLDSPGPIFFHQLRVGRCLPDRVDLFVMIKFRSMRVDAEAKTGAVWAARNDSRVTRVGRFLRATRLDELPQLVNVLNGEMSMVGPRPERPGIFNRLERALPFYGERMYYVRPGITGFAQINQGYDETLADVRRKLLYDHAYGLALHTPITWLRMDLHILLRTVIVMMCGRGQ